MVMDLMNLHDHDPANKVLLFSKLPEPTFEKTFSQYGNIAMIRLQFSLLAQFSICYT